MYTEEERRERMELRQQEDKARRERWNLELDEARAHRSVMREMAERQAVALERIQEVLKDMFDKSERSPYGG